jgi:hypothetical protein
MAKAPFQDFAPVVLKLMQDVMDHTDPLWGDLLDQQVTIRDYVAQIGLNLYIQENDGYAYLYQPEHRDENDKPLPLPRLTRRYRISYEATLLLVLLRERLDRFEIENPEADQLVMTLDDIWHMVEMFLPERNNEMMVRRRIDTAVNKLVDDLGILKARKDGGYIVQKVLKARLPSDKLLEVRERLYAHRDELLNRNA